jgi:hypothetical protein
LQRSWREPLLACNGCICFVQCLVFSAVHAQLPEKTFTPLPAKKTVMPRVPPPKNAHGRGHPPLDLGCHGGNPRRILRCLWMPDRPLQKLACCMDARNSGVALSGPPSPFASCNAKRARYPAMLLQSFNARSRSSQQGSRFLAIPCDLQLLMKHAHLSQSPQLCSCNHRSSPDGVTSQKFDV